MIGKGEKKPIFSSKNSKILITLSYSAPLCGSSWIRFYEWQQSFQIGALIYLTCYSKAFFSEDQNRNSTYKYRKLVWQKKHPTYLE